MVHFVWGEVRYILYAGNYGTFCMHTVIQINIYLHIVTSFPTSLPQFQQQIPSGIQHIRLFPPPLRPSPFFSLPAYFCLRAIFPTAHTALVGPRLHCQDSMHQYQHQIGSQRVVPNIQTMWPKLNAVSDFQLEFPSPCWHFTVHKLFLEELFQQIVARNRVGLSRSIYKFIFMLSLFKFEFKIQNVAFCTPFTSMIYC